jgi:hypothetical protein
MHVLQEAHAANTYVQISQQNDTRAGKARDKALTKQAGQDIQ